MRTLPLTLLILLIPLAAGRWPWQKPKDANAPPFRWPWQKKPLVDTLVSSDGTSATSRDGTCTGPTCSEPKSCAHTEGSEAAATCMATYDWTVGPRSGQDFIVDPLGVLLPETRFALTANLSRFNETAKYQMYIIVMNEIPQHDPEKPTSPRDFGKRLLRDWFPKPDKQVLIMLIMSPKARMEVTLGSKARRKIKEAQTRRVARKVQGKMMGQMDDAARLAVKEMVQALSMSSQQKCVRQ